MPKYIQSNKGYFYKIGNNGEKKRVSKEEFYKKKKFVGGAGNINNIKEDIIKGRLTVDSILKKYVIQKNNIGLRNQVIEHIKDLILTDKDFYQYRFDYFKKEDFNTLDINLVQLKKRGFTIDLLKDYFGYTKKDFEDISKQIYGNTLLSTFLESDLRYMEYTSNEISTLKRIKKLYLRKNDGVSLNNTSKVKDIINFF